MYFRSTQFDGKLNDEFGKIERAINFPVDAVRLENRGAPLAKPRAGDLVYANGISWNPGSGSGLYIYNGSSYTSLSISSTYTPITTNGANVASSTAFVCTFTRTGNLVMVAGKVDITTTAAGSTVLSMSLPIASAMTAEENLAGVGATGSTSAAIKADFTNDRAQLFFTAAAGGAESWFFNYSYRVL